MDRQQESSTSLQSQIMELEIRLAHQDRQIAELNEVIDRKSTRLNSSHRL